MEMLLNGLPEVLLLCIGFAGGYLLAMWSGDSQDPPVGGLGLYTNEERIKQINQRMQRAQKMGRGAVA